MAILRQNEPLTEEKQEHYYHKAVEPTFLEKHPQQILMSFLLDEACIGYGALVRIDWTAKQAEVSFLVDPTRAKVEQIYRTDFSHYLIMLKELAFTDLKLSRLYAETFDMRPLHVAVLESQGFVFEERLINHVNKEGKAIDSLIHGCYP